MHPEHCFRTGYRKGGSLKTRPFFLSDASAHVTMRIFPGNPAATGGPGRVITKVREPDGHDSELPSHKKQDFPMAAAKVMEIATLMVMGYAGRMFVQQKVDTKSLTSLPGHQSLGGTCMHR